MLRSRGRRNIGYRIGTLLLPSVLMFCPVGWATRPDSPTAGVPDATVARRILETAGIHGGLVVHLGCGDGHLTAALHAGDGYLVHGLDGDAETVRRARAYVRSRELHGSVSIDRLSDGELPYADGIVNLLVVTSDQWRAMRAQLTRVLAPGGVVMIRGAREASIAGLDTCKPAPLTGWTKLVKPWPSGIDQWTHYLHGPDNNAVADDNVVGPPRHYQWIAKPRFSRSHDHLASVSAVVSAGGRVFYIVDTGSIAFAAASPRWRLVARDAFSGVLLWQRKIDTWEYHLRDFRSGPADIARRLVADNQHVYVTLGYGQPVSALDAATGRTLRVYAGTERAHEIIHYRDLLLVVLGKPQRNWPAELAKKIVTQPGYVPPFENDTPPAGDKQLVAVRAETGKLVWKQSGKLTRTIMPSTLAAAGDHVYFQNANAVVCLDIATGQVRWQTPRPVEHRRLAWSTPTLVVHDGIVFSADRKPLHTEDGLLWIPSGGYHQYIRGEGIKGELVALDGETGKPLWNCPAYEGFNAPVDVMIADGLVWTGHYTWGRDPGVTEARDPRTGAVRRHWPARPMGGHARCHRAKATARYLLLGRVGVEYLDFKSGALIAHRWIRGMCQYGVMPANGLLYIPPHSCVCSIADMVKSGFVALAPNAADGGQKIPPPRRVQHGPAYDTPLAAAGETDTDWPTYRHDPQRSGTTPVEIPHQLRTSWSAELGGKLTAPVVAEGRVLVAQTDTHRVVALDAATGTVAWTFDTGARVDSPPTIHRGRALFGSSDGSVYCVRLTDGQLVWRFRAAPRRRWFVANDQLESAWPVSGSVLVTDGAVYFTAGRNSYLDGGMYLFELDAATGKPLKIKSLAVPPSDRDRGRVGKGFLPDVLSTDGQSIFMRGARFNFDLEPETPTVPHLWSSVGFLDDTWWHRTYWQFGTSMRSGWGGWPKAGQRVPAGRLLVTDGARVLGYGRNQYDIPGAHVGIDARGVWGPIGPRQGRWTYYRLFKKTLKQPAPGAPGRASSTGPTATTDWSQQIPILAQAMVLAHDTLWIAGPANPLHAVPHRPAAVDAMVTALESSRGGHLLAVNAADGDIKVDLMLASPPVFDGMAVTPAGLYLATRKGTVRCMTK